MTKHQVFINEIAKVQVTSLEKQVKLLTSYGFSNENCSK